MKELEARKRLLVAESEVYRQTLRLDVQNLRLYSFRVRRKFAGYAALKPLFLAGLPLASALFARKKAKEEAEKPRSLLSNVIAGFRLYRQLQPLLAGLMAQYAAREYAGVEPSQPAEPQEETAADEGSTRATA